MHRWVKFVVGPGSGPVCHCSFDVCWRSTLLNLMEDDPRRLARSARMLKRMGVNHMPCAALFGEAG